ncbi:hypothetical protein ACFWYW_38135 [Nonomuraea sp. NPDC059023]|uniref:hypothetical protein n=1 Tax=unclassified Nonomuraea TaxID=2593643 RepID=UPI00367CCA65
MNDAATAQAAASLVQRLLLTGRSRAHTSIHVVEPGVTSATDMLVDFPARRVLGKVTTSMDGKAVGPALPQYFAEGALRMPVETTTGTHWAEVEGPTFWDWELGLLLAIGGVRPGPAAGTVMNPWLARENLTEPSLRTGLDTTLATLGWRNPHYQAPTRAMVHSDGLGVQMEAELGDERGLAVEELRYTGWIRSAPEAEFPPWPEASARYDADSFVRALIPDWPEELPTTPWQGL